MCCNCTLNRGILKTGSDRYQQENLPSLGLAVNYALIYRFNVCAPAVQSLYADNQTKAEIGLKVYVACTGICYNVKLLYARINFASHADFNGERGARKQTQ